MSFEFFLSFLPIYHITALSNLNASIIAHYKLDGDLSDSSGNNHDGNLNTNGTEQYSSEYAISSEAFYFDGFTRIEIQSLSNYDWDSTGYISFSLWIKSTKTDKNGHMQLINNGNYYCASFEVRIARDNSLQAAIFGKNHVNHSDTVGFPLYGHSFIFRNTLGANQWEHIVLTFNKYKERTEQLSLYLNGKLLGKSEITDDGDEIINHEQPFYIGHAGHECVSNDDYFSGYMDEIILFADELNEKEVSIIYNDGIESMDGVNETEHSDDIQSTSDDIQIYTTSVQEMNEEDKKSVNSVVIVGIVLASVICILLVIVGYLCYRNRNSHSKYGVVRVSVATKAETTEMMEGETRTTAIGPLLMKRIPSNN